MATNKAFLDAFIEYESACRDILGIAPLDREDKVDAPTSKRLGHLRRCRNYLVHENDPNFISIPDTALKFLTDQTKKIRTSGNTVKKHMKCSLVLKDTDTVAKAIEAMVKDRFHQCLVIAKGKNPKVVSLASCAAAVLKSKCTKLKDVKAEKVTINVVSADSMMNDIDEGVLNVVEDGKGNMTGVVVP